MILKLSEIRNKHYDHERKKSINVDADIDDWKYSPYNCFKARIYIELSSLLVFVFQFTRIPKPNNINVYNFWGFRRNFFITE